MSDNKLPLSAGLKNAAKVLRTADSSAEERRRALIPINEWRASCAYPLTVFNNTLRTKLNKLNIKGLVAQRLKRMPTIIDKLERQPTMQIKTMGDIAGLRVIVPSVQAVEEIYESYKKSRFQHRLIKTYDYIKTPKPKTGYRGMHLIYQYKHEKREDALGQRIEIQIRTDLQHHWATAVEVATTMLDGQRLKFEEGSNEWLSFFALASSLFAIEEGKPLREDHRMFSREEIIRRILSIDKKINAQETLKNFSQVAEELSDTSNNRRVRKFWLITLSSDEGAYKAKVTPDLTKEEAIKKYQEKETQMKENENIVLVAAERIGDLKTAYSNYFLDTEIFLENLKDRICKSK